MCVAAGGTIHLEDSVVTALEASSLGASSAVGVWVGVTTNDAKDVRVTRSRMLTVLDGFGWNASAGTVIGAELEATDRIFIDNSVARTPRGGNDNYALYLHSSGPQLPSAHVYHVTAVNGDDWNRAELAPRPFRSASIRLGGNMRELHLYNSALSNAAGHGGTPDYHWRYTTLWISGMTANPVTLRVRGNAMSANRNYCNGGLMLCLIDPQCEQTLFNYRINDANQYQCAPWSTTAPASYGVSSNLGYIGDKEIPSQYIGNPNGDVLMAFDVDGPPHMPGSPGVRHPAAFGAVALSSLPLGDAVVTDIAGTTRPTGTSTAAGAWR